MSGNLYPWCRRIFASVDVIGSTAFKNRYPENSASWAYVFKQFFDEFPTTLRACFDRLPAIANGRPATPMGVWKFAGDEILFAAELKRHEEVAFHAIAFKNALNEYSLQFRKKPELASLALKGTVWGAGFPVSNAEVKTKLGSTELVDYVGPCIDQGFRLCSLADTRRIPISADIAWMLAMTTASPEAKLSLYCDEPRSHKGIPHAYPSIWLDRLDGARSAEDEVLERKPATEAGKLKAYLEELFKRDPGPLQRPFIVSDESIHFKDIPPAMAKKREDLLTAAAEKTYTETEEREAQGAKRETPPAAQPALDPRAEQ